MATLSEKDEAPPTPRIFTKRIPLEEYDKIGAQETEIQLNSLLMYLEENPQLFAEYLKKCHIKRMEESGFFSSIKAKVLTAFYGDDFVNIDQETQEKKWREFQSTTGIVYNRAQEMKGNAHKFSRRYSKRIAERQCRQQAKNTTKSMVPPAPPPPPLVTNITSSMTPYLTSSPSSKHNCSAVKVVDHEMRNLSRQIVKRRPLHEVSNTTPDKTSKKKKRRSSTLQDEILLAKKNLKSVAMPDETPYQFCKNQRQLKKAKENHDENAFPLFNQELIRKFRNTRSPQSPKNSTDHSQFSPGQE